MRLHSLSTELDSMDLEKEQQRYPEKAMDTKGGHFCHLPPYAMRAHLRDIAGLLPDHCNKVNITIKGDK